MKDLQTTSTFGGFPMGCYMYYFFVIPCWQFLSSENRTKTMSEHLEHRWIGAPTTTSWEKNKTHFPANIIPLILYRYIQPKVGPRMNKSHNCIKVSRVENQLIFSIYSNSYIFRTAANSKTLINCYTDTPNRLKKGWAMQGTVGHSR